MNEMDPKAPVPGAEDVSRAYEAAAFDEEPPAHVDRAILAAARRRPRLRLTAFVPAFALAATVVLSFSIVLRSGMLDFAGQPTPALDDLGETAPAPATQSRELEETTQVLPAGAGTADAPAEPATAPAATGRRERAFSEPSILERDQASSVEAESAGVDVDTAPADLAQPEAAVEVSESLLLRSSAPELDAESCEAFHASGPTVWLDCISRQVDAGNEVTAVEELQEFTSSFPDYELPPELEMLLER